MTSGCCVLHRGCRRMTDEFLRNRRRGSGRRQRNANAACCRWASERRSAVNCAMLTLIPVPALGQRRAGWAARLAAERRFRRLAVSLHSRRHMFAVFNIPLSCGELHKRTAKHMVEDDSLGLARRRSASPSSSNERGRWSKSTWFPWRSSA
jgi:hypothetical protein